MNGYTACRTPVHRGPAAWSAILPGQGSPVVFESDAKADFTIIGAGFAGLSAARRLTQLAPEAKIAVLEAGRIAEGACGRNSGFMIDLPHEVGGGGYEGQGAEKNKAMIALNRQAIEFARQAVEAYSIDRNYFDPVGKVNGAATARADGLNRSYAAHLAEIGEVSEYLDAKSMIELTGSNHYISGLYTPGTAMIQPAGYVRGVVRELRKDGVQVYEHSAVQKIERIGDSWSVSSNGHHVSTGKVLMANNGHLESFGFAKRKLTHIFLYASMTVDLGSDALKKLGG